MRCKIGTIIIENRKFLVVRKKDEDYFKTPGGGIKKAESEIEVLRREVMEEIGVKVKNPEHFITYEDFGSAGKIQITLFITTYSGKPKPSNEIEEIKFIDSTYKKKGIKVPNGLEKFVIPKLIKMNLID